MHWLEAKYGGMVFSTARIARDLDWSPDFTLKTGLADSYRWFEEGGRERYSYDFSTDEAILAAVAARSAPAV